MSVLTRDEVQPASSPESVPSPTGSDTSVSTISSSDSDSTDSPMASPEYHAFEQSTPCFPKMFAALLEVVDREWCAIYQSDEEKMES